VVYVEAMSAPKSTLRRSMSGIGSSFLGNL
jgi:hypothetical protein